MAQLVGAFVGAALTLIILTGNDPAKLGLGAVSVNANAGLAIGFAAEVIGTAILVFTVFGSAVSGKAPAGFAGLVIGFIVYGIIILVGPITGASLNPARELGPALLGQAIGATPVPVDQLLVVYVFGSTARWRDRRLPVPVHRPRAAGGCRLSRSRDREGIPKR